MTTTAPAHIDPSESQIAGFMAAAQQQDGPVVMVNLLQFNDEEHGGAASYERYAKEVQPHLDRVGASALCAGTSGQLVIGADGQHWWDAVVVVQYPSRQKFLEMVLDADYQAIAVHRTAALTNSALVATDPWAVEL